MRPISLSRIDGDRLAWPLLLLLLMVLVSSAGVVWMMREAVRNERLAAEQRLREAYQIQLESAAEIVQKRWRERLDRLAEQSRERTPGEAFAIAVAGYGVSSLLVLDADGSVLYPESGPSSRNNAEPVDVAWREALGIEFVERAYSDAADAYARIAGEASRSGLRAKARQAEIRSLLKAGKRKVALDRLRAQSDDTVARDEQGRSYAAAAELHLLELLPRESDEWVKVSQDLQRRLASYEEPSLPSSQRLFLMNALQELAPMQWPNQSAEELAAEAVAVRDDGLIEPRLQITTEPEVWSCASTDGRIVALYRTEALGDTLVQLTEGLSSPSGVAFTATAPQETSESYQEAPLGNALGDWRLGFSAAETNPFAAKSMNREAVHSWIAGLIVALMCALAWMLANAMRRQTRLARLKNDLVATVSHELKTPLAAIRLLVDTLLADTDEADSKPSIDVREYLQLIAQENTRLTRLIDSFLTFSRLERGKQRYDFRMIDVREIIDRAAAVVRDRWIDADHFLNVDYSALEAGQPTVVHGDIDALVTALINLLENAWKFTGEDRRIVLSAKATNDRVTVAVRDNGIGLSERASRRVFDRFFQVDQRVARTQDGCGLGLSIVRAIARSHGGEARAEGRLGEGSTFSLELPRGVGEAAEEYL